jgi:hypothetical protein
MSETEPMHNYMRFFWDNGAYISTEHPNFAEDFAGLVLSYGAPHKLEDDDGYRYEVKAILDKSPFMKD